MRKQVFSYLLPFVFLSASGQSIQLQDLWNKQNSDTIYVGIENVFKISGSLSDLIRIECDQAPIKMNGNSFSISPRYAGTVKIEYITTTAKTEFVVTSVYLPLVRAVFEDKNGNESTYLKMADLPQLKGIALKCPANNNLVSDFQVLSFIVSSNGRSYEFQGDSLRDIYKKLPSLCPDDILLLEKVNLLKKPTGLQMHLANTNELTVK
jgi:hypothetical protein